MRTGVGVFDVSHMGELLMSGPDAEKQLNRLVTNQVAGMPNGKVLYSLMCNEDGGIVDDLLIYNWSGIMRFYFRHIGPFMKKGVNVIS